MNTSTSKKIPVLNYTRVVGYFSPSSNWNKGKAAEIADRRPFDANKFINEGGLENV